MLIDTLFIIISSKSTIRERTGSDQKRITQRGRTWQLTDLKGGVFPRCQRMMGQEDNEINGCVHRFDAEAGALLSISEKNGP
jgi:hypothetical protein